MSGTVVSMALEPFAGKKGESGAKFLRKFKRLMAGKTDVEKMAEFELFIDAESVADLWWAKLPSASKLSWAAIEAAFVKRWPSRTLAEKTEADYENELLTTRIGLKELGEKKVSDGGEAWKLHEWADEMEMLAEGARAYAGSMYVGPVIRGLPAVLQGMLEETYSSWSVFLAAVRAVNMAKLKAAVDRELEKERRLASVEEQLRAQALRPAASMTALSQQMAALNVGNQGAAGQAPVVAYQGARGVGGGVGQTRMPRSSGGPPAPLPVTAELQAAMRKAIAEMVQHPDTEEGRRLHGEQQVEWTRKHGVMGWVTELTPYPLRPGTAPVCSGECWGCGKEGHRGSECTVLENMKLSRRERTWRRLCAQVLGAAGAVGSSSSSVPVRWVPTDDYGHGQMVEGGKDVPQKWRICQNFAEVNKVTQVAPMPQGDIWAKQQRLSGHRWISLFDFASGFYAVLMDEESRPYTAFYVEGMGFFWYRKMPFGLHTAPTRFAEMTARHLHDLLAEGIMELFVDDGGTSGDEYEGMMSNLRRILMRVRERGLSLSAAKTILFATEGVFAGSAVGPDGVQPDRAKLTAVVGWKRPANGFELEKFLGLTGYFRGLIKGYAMEEKPLRDLLRQVVMPAGCATSVYRKTMRDFDLKAIWGEEQEKAFIRLKGILTSGPVLKAPRFDGSSFVVTTDGCADAFGAVLAQRFTTHMPNGVSVERMHPLGFASKRTSATEQRYKSFLLEFAALKFGLDKFADTVWGFPVEIETDCQALRDLLTNEKLSATHARWLGGIMAYQIVKVRHVPGKANVVADGLSRKDEGRPKEEGDGSEWTVSEDWESVRGLASDVWTMGVEGLEVEKLLDRFKEPLFREVIGALKELEVGVCERKRKRAMHRAEGYMVEDGRLWRVGKGKGVRARARLECITAEEAEARAEKVHREGGHWGRDAVKLRLMDEVWCPRLDVAVVKAIENCGKCKNFGAAHIHALLNPITRRRPFELLVGDYLSMPNGTGGYHTIGVYLDTYSQHMWAHKYKTAGTAKTTVKSLEVIFNSYVSSETCPKGIMLIPQHISARFAGDANRPFSCHSNKPRPPPLLILGNTLNTRRLTSRDDFLSNIVE